MNKWVVGGIILLLVVVGFFAFSMYDGEDTSLDEESAPATIDEVSDEQFAEVESSDAVLNEIDDSVGYLD